MRYVLDAPALINNPGFRFSDSGKPYLTTDEVLMEWKDFRTRLTAEHAVKTGQLKIKAPRASSLELVRATAKRLGVTGLSAADESVIALALDENGWERTTLITDDYRVQNVALSLKINLEGAMMDGIKNVRQFGGTKPASGSAGSSGSPEKAMPPSSPARASLSMSDLRAPSSAPAAGPALSPSTLKYKRPIAPENPMRTAPAGPAPAEKPASKRLRQPPGDELGDI